MEGWYTELLGIGIGKVGREVLASDYQDGAVLLLALEEDVDPWCGRADAGAELGDEPRILLIIGSSCPPVGHPPLGFSCRDVESTGGVAPVAVDADPPCTEAPP